MSNEIPRRSRIDLFVPAERAIWEAAQAVEAMPPDVRLTNAGNKLQEARALVADFVDGVPLGEGYPRPSPDAATDETWFLRNTALQGWLSALAPYRDKHPEEVDQRDVSALVKLVGDVYRAGLTKRVEQEPKR